MSSIYNYIKENKIQFYCLIVLLVIFTVRFLNQSKELNDFGLEAEGLIVKCNLLKINGACSVDVEFYTQQGEKRISHNTLYKEGNCALGKKVKIKYSVKSDLTDVVE